MPKATEKTATRTEEEAIKIEDDDLEADTGGHGVINPIEAWHHVQWLDEVLQMMMMRLSGYEVKDVLKDTLNEF